jgi:tryptophan-rich sensory protein
VTMKKLIIYLLLNFSALALGSYLMGEGPLGPWYNGLNKAPWTPPGWVFGASWTLIMICLSIFMWKMDEIPSFRPTLRKWFAIQWILNVLWNPLFFALHLLGWSLIEIIVLEFFLAFMAIKARQQEKYITWLLTPYVVWLAIAITLNAYAFQNN